MVENFKEMSDKNRIEIDFFLVSPLVEGSYNVFVATYDPRVEQNIDLNSVLLPISSTYGFMQEFRTHAVKAAITLKAGERGHLELTYFLRQELPATNSGFEGEFKVECRPQIPLPPASRTFIIYFYGNIPAQYYKMYNAAPANSSFTLFHFKTPQLRTFHESEIPITITTKGDSLNQNGLDLPTIIQRYVFHIEIFKNLATEPHEVHFTDWVPTYLSASVTGDALVKEQDESTVLKVEYTV